MANGKEDSWGWWYSFFFAKLHVKSWGWFLHFHYYHHHHRHHHHHQHHHQHLTMIDGSTSFSSSPPRLNGEVCINIHWGAKQSSEPLLINILKATTIIIILKPLYNLQKNYQHLHTKPFCMFSHFMMEENHKRNSFVVWTLITWSYLPTWDFRDGMADGRIVTQNCTLYFVDDVL